MILKELSEAVGVSGDEGPVRKIILKAIEGHAQDIHIDALGSVTARKAGTDGADRPRIMLAAHMDEVGFMVRGTDSDGLIRFSAIGGIDARILPGLRVKVGAKQIPGVILWTPIHHNNEQNIVKINNLRIDIGASSKDNGQAKPGDRIAFDSAYAELSAQTRRGKAFDDRVGCALLVDILQGGPYPVDILAAFTVQEEVGLRGAGVAARRLQPDLALALETTPAYDLPDPAANPDDREHPNPSTRLGDGPALTLMDGSVIVDPRLLRWLRAAGDTNSIPYQFKTALGGGTDAGAIHIANEGVPSAVVSVPCRYIHSPHALMHMNDYHHALQLVQAALGSLSAAVLARN
jgi:endoglucanase